MPIYTYIQRQQNRPVPSDKPSETFYNSQTCRSRSPQHCRDSAHTSTLQPLMPSVSPWPAPWRHSSRKTWLGRTRREYPVLLIVNCGMWNVECGMWIEPFSRASERNSRADLGAAVTAAGTRHWRCQIPVGRSIDAWACKRLASDDEVSTTQHLSMLTSTFRHGAIQFGKTELLSRWQVAVTWWTAVSDSLIACSSGWRRMQVIFLEDWRDVGLCFMPNEP